MHTLLDWTTSNDYIWRKRNFTMKTMAITEFKVHALKVLSQVAKSKEPVIITKRGQPLVQVIPFVENAKENTPGKLAELLVFENDIVSDLGTEIWDACR